MLNRRQALTTAASAAALAAAGPALPFSHGLIPPNYPTPTGIVTPISQSSPLSAITGLPAMAPMTPDANTITVDSSTLYQSIIGLGGAMTDSAAYCFQNYLTSSQQTALLTQMFSGDGLNALRICIGSQSFMGNFTSYFTYDDVANDTTLANFSIANDLVSIIPIIKQILAINPNIQIAASIWSPPAWIKSNDSLIAGDIVDNSTNFTFLAAYMVKCIQAYAAQGITINYICPQNEPEITAVYPTTIWNDSQYIDFIQNYLISALSTAGLTTKIHVGDAGGFDITNFITDCTGNSTIRAALGGVCSHAYSGVPVQTANLMTSYPSIPIMMTEFRSLMSASLASTQTTMAELAIDSWRNSFGWFTFWNIALDQNGAPNVPGSASTGRRGVLTINNSTGVVTQNPEYNLLAHVGRYAPSGTQRSNCNTFSQGSSGTDLQAVSFLQPNGTRAVFFYNANSSTRAFKVYDQQRAIGFPMTLNPGDMATVSWPGH